MIISDEKGNDEALHKAKTDELMFNLEIFIECLVENVELFKLVEKPTFVQRQEFLHDYINLEENILKTFDQLNYVQLNLIEIEEIEKLIQVFNKNWKDYQDDWLQDMWDLYEIVRKKENRGIITFHIEEEKKEDEVVTKNHNLDSTREGNINKEVDQNNLNNSKSNYFSFGSEFREMMKKYRSNGNGSMRLNSLQTEENLIKIDQEIKILTKKEHDYKIKNNQHPLVKERRCLGFCCGIY